MDKQPYKKPEISRVRKILILVFMISFWILFYWNQDSEITSKMNLKTNQRVQGTN